MELLLRRITTKNISRVLFLYGTYFRTWATVFGPYHWPMGFPSPTPIWAAGGKKKT